MTMKEITNTDQIVQDLARLANQFPQAVEQAMFKEASIIMSQSQDECPVEFGILRATGRVDDPIVKQGRISIKLGYSADYALYVHENLEAYHIPPTKAKYLEDPLMLRLSYNILPSEILRRAQAIVEGI